MPRLTDHWKILGAASATALAIGVVAGPAVAAGELNATVTYNCNAGAFSAPATFAVQAPPAQTIAGEVTKLRTTATITLGSDVTGLAASIGWKSFDGTLSAAPSKTAGYNLTIARTTLANNSDGSTTAAVSGNVLVRPKQAGSYTVKFGAIGASLQGYDASGAKTGDPLAFTCANQAGTTEPTDANGAPAAMKVSKDKTTTGVKAAYSAAKHAAKATAKVKAHFGLKPTGKVTFVLKKGAKTVATVKAKVNKKGQAKAAFKVTKKGAYKVKASYGGDKALKPSNGTAKFTA